MKENRQSPEIRMEGFEDDWIYNNLRKLAIFNPKTEPPEEFEYVDLESVVGTEMMYHRKEKRDTAPSRAQRVAQYGDLFYQTVRPYQKNNYLFEKEECYVFSTGYAQIRPFAADGYFLLSLVQNNSFVKKVLDNCTGTSYPAINANDLADIKIHYPVNYSEQERIGCWFRNIDLFISLHNKEIKRLECLRKAMVEKMFPQNGADVPAVRFGQYKEPWRLCQFFEIFKERHIIDTISDEYPQLAFTIEEGVIRPEDKKTNKRDFLIIDKANKKYLQTEYDDIIYNPANVIYGAIHRNALGKGCVSPIYKIFYTDQDSTFMECIVRHPRFIKEISRSMEGTVKKLRTLKPKAFLEKRAYIAPTIEEQQQIGEYFRQMDRLIEIEKEKLEKIKHIKSACMEKMFV